MFEQLGLIGCGLMGGSFALALKRAGLVKRVVGYSKSPSTTDKARQLGVIDIEATSALLAVSGSDIVLLAVPVSATEATLKAIKHLVTPDTLIMDVGSTKTDVIESARRALPEQMSSFVPAHPIAGKETAGVENAEADLYKGCHVILTPTSETDPRHLNKAIEVWTALGARVLKMAAKPHDIAFAAVSHLPHLLAFSMMQSLLMQPHGKKLLALAGPGFRDFSRIAASDPKIWRDILLSNKTELQTQIGYFKSALALFEKMIQNDEGEILEFQINQASQLRSEWELNRKNKQNKEKSKSTSNQQNSERSSGFSIYSDFMDSISPYIKSNIISNNSNNNNNNSNESNSSNNSSGNN